MKKIMAIILVVLMVGGFCRETLAQGATVKQETPENNAADGYRAAFAEMPLLTPKEDSLIRDWDRVPLEEEAIAVVRKSDPCLDLLQRAAVVSQCDWGIIPAGPKTQMPHLDKARSIARLDALRIRYRCSQKDNAGAVADILAMLTLARHTEDNGYGIALLIGRAIEQMGIKAATMNLMKLDRDSLQKFMAGLQNLPPCKTTSEIFLAEKRYLIEYQIEQLKKRVATPNVPQGSIDFMIPTLEHSASCYAKWAEIASLPPEEFEKRLKEMEGKLKGENAFVGPMIKSAITTRYNVAAAEVRMTMLKAAIEVVMDGPERLAAYLDAQGQPLFEYTPTENGFDLKSKTACQNKPVELQILGK